MKDISTKDLVTELARRGAEGAEGLTQGEAVARSLQGVLKSRALLSMCAELFKNQDEVLCAILAARRDATHDLPGESETGKREFLISLTLNVLGAMLKDLPRVPEHWDGHHLRAWLADRFERTQMSAKKPRSFKNDMLVNNL